MQRYLTSLVQLAACFVLALGIAANADDKKANPTGTWKWSFTTQSGESRETTLKLKMEGEKLVGTVTGRGGETAIEEAKLKGDEISFQVTREFQGNKFVAKYHGKIAGDTIKGTIESQRGDQTRKTEWEAKRVKESGN